MFLLIGCEIRRFRNDRSSSSSSSPHYCVIIIIIIVITYRNMCLVIIPLCSDFRMGLHNHEKSYEVCICS